MTYSTSAADEYTPEKLAELRKNAKSAPSTKKPEDDIQVVLKNTTPLARREGTFYSIFYLLYTCSKLLVDKLDLASPITFHNNFYIKQCTNYILLLTIYYRAD